MLKNGYELPSFSLIKRLIRQASMRGASMVWLATRPCRTVEDKIDGVVITFVDISDQRPMEKQLRGV